MDRAPVCLVVQHAEPEEPYAIADALVHAGVGLDVRRVQRAGTLPGRLEGFGGLVVMGGPMSASSDEGFPTRAAELELLLQALDAGVPVLGVCLGAQLLAVAGGGSVLPGADGPEIGWGPVELLDTAATDPLFRGVGGPLEVLHWHGETFTLGAGAELLATSERYPQAFRVGAAAWGLQFHLEVDERALARLVAAFPDDAELAPGGARELTARSAPAVAGLERWARTVLGRFATAVAEGALDAGHTT